MRQQTRADRRSDPAPSVYDELARILIEEAERQEQEAKAS